MAAMSDWLLPRTGQPLLASRQKVQDEIREAGEAVDRSWAKGEHDSTNAAVVAAMAAVQYRRAAR